MDEKKMTPEEMAVELRKLRESFPMDGSPVDAKAILAKLAEIRASMPLEWIEPRRKAKPERERLSGMNLRTQEDFDNEAVLDAVQELLADAEAVAAAGRERAFEMALDVYHAAEELIRDPENANLIPHYEDMRRAFIKDYGHPPPTKAETLARRAREAKKKGK